jgi:hypothetical protein
MTETTRHQGRWTWTRITVLGLVISTLAAVLPLLLRADTGYVLIPGALLLLTAGLVWRFGLAAHVLAAVLGFWLLLTNSWYTLANISGATDSVGVLLTEALAALGGGITLFGAVRYLLSRRRRVDLVEGGLPHLSLPTTAGPVGDNRLLLYRLSAGVAIAVQVVLLFRSFVMGLGWGGSWYVANLGQAVLFLALALALLRKRPLLVLPLPVVSLLLMQAFQAADPSLKTTECTPAELSAVAEFPPPPGSPTPQFQSEPENGCIARFNSTLTGDEILDHYRLAAEDAGWEVEDPGEVLVEPGQEPVTPGTGSLSMNKAPMNLELSFEPTGDEGPASNQTWVVLSVS